MQEPAKNNDEKVGRSLKIYLLIIGVISLAPILVVFFAGLILAITGEAASTSQRIGSIRDVIIIIVFFELLLIVVALVGLTVQVMRLVSTLQGELQPMIANTREATETVRGTARFVSRNLAMPIMSFWAVIAGVTAFMKEIGGIRRSISKKK